MNSSSFDLNVDNYSVQELASMLELRQPYNASNVSGNANKLKEKVLQNESTMDINKRNEVADFLEKASQKILEAIREINKPEMVLSFMDHKNKLFEATGDNHVIESQYAIEGLKAKPWAGKQIDGTNHPPGMINPVNISTIKKTVNIDTRFRANYYNTSSSNFGFTMPSRITDVVSMRLASIEIPITYYVVSQYNGNSYFKIEWDYDSNGGIFAYRQSGLVKIPDGNYEPFWEDATLATDLASTINRYIQALTGDGAPGSEKIKNIVYSVDRISGRSGFAWKTGSSTTPEPFKVTFGVDEYGVQDITTNLQLRLGWLLGFRVSAYQGDSITSEGICYMKGPRYAFLCIKDYNNSVSDYFVSAFSSSILQADIIARINLTSIQQTNGVYQSGQDDGSSIQINRQRNYFGPVDIERLEIKLIDEYGRVIDLNNMDWSMALTMECIYAN
jgi:hypothetical protein